MDVVVSWDGDHIGRQVGRAVLNDNVDEVRRVDQAIQAGNELWRAFALRCGGSIVEIGGDEGRILIGAAHLAEMPAVARQYAEVVGASVSVGVGMKLSESANALLVAKLRGGNQILVWDSDMQEEIAAATANPKTEQEKIADEYLGKADDVPAPPPSHGGAGPAPVGGNQPQKTPKMVTPPQPDVPDAGKDFESQLHDLAQMQSQKDDSDAAGQVSHMDDVKAKVAETLTMVRQQLPIIQQLRQAMPEVYSTIMGLVQGLIALAREISGGDQPVQKSEDQHELGDVYVTYRFENESNADDFFHAARDRYEDEWKGIGVTYQSGADVVVRAWSDKNQETFAKLAEEHGGKPTDNHDLDHHVAPEHFDKAAQDPSKMPPGSTSEPFQDSPQSTGQNMNHSREGTNSHQGGGAQAGRAHLFLPAGTTLDGKIKIRHADGSAGWKNVHAGMISGQEADAPLLGANSYPVSSRQPGKK